MSQPHDPQQSGYYNTAQFPATGGFAYPATGAQPAQTPPGEPKKGRTVVVLTVLAIVLLAGAATFGTLYFVEKGDHQTTSEQLDSTRSDLTAAQQDARTAHTDLQNKNTELQSTKSQLTQANQDKETAQNAQKASAKDKACAATARKVIAAALKHDEKAGQAAAEELFTSC